MLNKVKNATEKWGGSHEVIDTWLLERQKLLVQYCELAGTASHESSPELLPTDSAIGAFCETLVDYVSAGHFEIYDKVVNGKTDVAQAKELLNQLVPDITTTTDQALKFHDTYADSDTLQDFSKFDRNLSELGQALEDRFELEDKLISTLHQQSA